MNRLRVAAVILLAFLGVTAASANTLVSTNPISGSTVSVSPTNVTVTGQVTLLSDAPDALISEIEIVPSSTRTPQASEQQTPASSSWGTNVFVIILLVLAVFVTIGLSLYARKLFSER